MVKGEKGVEDCKKTKSESMNEENFETKRNKSIDLLQLSNQLQ